jgi:hypothetical protein
MNELNTGRVMLMTEQPELVESAIQSAVGELLRAIGVHPTWPTLLTNYDAEFVAGVLVRIRAVNDEKDARYKPSADCIIMEELAETLEAAQRGDLEAARMECVQTIAMLLRLYVHLPDYCQMAKGGDPRTYDVRYPSGAKAYVQSLQIEGCEAAEGGVS